MTLKLISLLAVLLVSSVVFATEDENLEIIPRGDFSSFDIPRAYGFQNRSFITPLAPSEIYVRTQSVLQYYNSPVLPTGHDELLKLNNFQNADNIKKLLKFFDMHQTFDKLYTLSPHALIGYEDYLGKTHETFNISLNSNANFKSQRPNISPTQPLRGLRVAIDPGHMGTEYWDKITGKFIRDSKGNSLSEGVMALQTSLLLKTDLESLGATVVLTRTDMGPSTDMPMDKLPIPEFARQELLEQVYSPWFLKLLSVGTGKTLTQAFDQSPERKKLWDEKSRYNYFILKEDLWSRAEKIQAFDPDIVLIVHYDILPYGAAGNMVNPNAPNQTKIFVTGGYFDVEFGSRKARKQFAKKLLNQQQWDESLNLSRKILGQMQAQMGLTLPTISANSIMVEPGIFARNLTLPRFLDAPAVAYLECLFYNRPQEFYAFLDQKHPMIINGVNYPYSDRLYQVVTSIKQGVLDYVQGP